MPGTVRAVIDGRTYTASRNYSSFQHSGEPSEVYQFLPDFAAEAVRRSGYEPRDFEGGDVTVVVDGELVSKGVGKFPESETGSADQSGFGFGGLGAKIDILNYGRTADRSFTVRLDGQGHGQGAWTTVVDGETLAERDEMRPYSIQWEDGGGGGGFL